MKPATGTCTWLKPALNGNPQLEITVDATSHIYEIVRSEQGGFKMLRADPAKADVIVYNVKCVARNVWTCNCPDAEYRRHGQNCKHARALPAALRQLPF